MSSASSKILQQALALPEEERRRVGETLVGSVPHDSDAEIEEAWNQEAIRRAERLERGEVESLDGAEALRKLRAKLASIHE